MKFDIENLEAELPTKLEPNGPVLQSWKFLQDRLQSLPCSSSAFNGNAVSDNGGDSGVCDTSVIVAPSLFIYIAKSKGLEIPQETFSVCEQHDNVGNFLAKLENLYLPVVFILFARVIFYHRKRQDGEKVEDYFQVLEAMSEFCEFGPDRNFIVKQQFLKSANVSPSLRCHIQESSPLSLKQIFNAFLKVTKAKTKISSSSSKNTGRRKNSQIHEKMMHKEQKLKRIQNEKHNKSNTGCVALKSNGDISQGRMTKHAANFGLKLDLNNSNLKGHSRPKRFLAEGRQSLKRTSNNKDKVMAVEMNDGATFSSAVSTDQGNSHEDEKGSMAIEEMALQQISQHKTTNNDSESTPCHCDDEVLRLSESVNNTKEWVPSAPLQSTAYDVKRNFTGKRQEQKSFTCQSCKLSFSKLPAYKDHIKTHVCECKECGTKFAYPALLDRHMSKHTGIKHIHQKATPPKHRQVKRKFHCSTCRFTFPSAARLKNHIVSVCETCKGDNTNQGCTHERTKKYLGSKRPKQHPCDLCGAAFHGIYELYEHSRVHTLQNDTECHPSGESMTNTVSKSKEHYNVIPTPRGNISVLGDHIRLCTDPSDHSQQSKQPPEPLKKPYHCSVCGERFTKKVYLNNHVRSHSGETPYTCELCGACFKARWNLSRHYLVHTGTKPHVCLVCNRSFKWQSTLSTHMKSHHDSPGVLQQCVTQKHLQVSDKKDSQIIPNMVSSHPPPPPLIHPPTNEFDSRNVRTLETFQAQTTYHRNFQQRYSQDQQGLPPQSRSQHLPSATHSDLSRMVDYSNTGLWSPFLDGVTG